MDTHKKANRATLASVSMMSCFISDKPFLPHKTESDLFARASDQVKRALLGACGIRLFEPEMRRLKSMMAKSSVALEVKELYWLNRIS